MSAIPTAALAATLASGGVESVGFFNDIVEQLWDYINIAGATMARTLIEPMFKELLPGPLKSLHFTKIDLGKKPIRFENVDVHSRSESTVKLDIDIIWDGECDIGLRADIIGPFGVRHIKLKGRMSVLLRPVVARMPLFTAMQVAFINPPELKLNFTGVAQVADFAVIDKTVRRIMNQIIASILVLPNRMLIKIDPNNVFFNSYLEHLGFLRLKIVGGKGFKVQNSFPIRDVPDCYCITRLGASEPWTTATIDNNLSPQWNETNDFLLADHDQLISLEVWDSDIGADDGLGKAEITVGDLLLAGKSKELPLFMNDKDTGASVTIQCQVLPFVTELKSFGAEEHKAQNLKCGIITILVAGASKVPGKATELAPSVKIKFGTNEFTTPTVYDAPGIDTSNPAFDYACRVLMTIEESVHPPDFSFSLMDKCSEIGHVLVPFTKVVASKNRNLTGSFSVGHGAKVDISIRIHGIKKTPT